MEATDRRQRAAREAAEWFVRLESDLPRAERSQFVAWLQESPIHIAEMIRLAQIHGALEKFAPWGQSTGGELAFRHQSVIPFPVRTGDRLLPRASSTAGTATGRYRLMSKRKWTGAAAAIAVLVLAAGVILPKFRGQVIDTERGERREVVLNDGSMVLVDPETRMRVKYAKDSRRVFLEHGRALFRVAKNPARPFLVSADGTVVRAVGTAFGVDQQSQGIVVTVVEGKVAVLSSEPDPFGAHAQESVGRGAGPLFLTSDQQVTVPRSGPIETVRSVDSRRELAWAEGRLVFRNYTVATIIEEFNRYNRVQLEVTDPALAERTVSGVFNASDPESFISFLQSVVPLSVLHQDERTITISLRRTN